MDTKNISVNPFGGSLIAPESGINKPFLHSFQQLIRDETPERKFCIITGGGAICRDYQQALSDLTDADDTKLDWMGIYMTRLHGQFVRLMFGDLAYNKVVLTPNTAAEALSQTPVVVGAAGDTPGRSSDYEAVAVAEAIGADHLVNLSNISHIYDADPDKNPDAKPVNKLSWSQYQDMIPGSWEPGLHTPFDPVSAEFARECGMEVAVMSGTPIDNLRDYLNNDDFTGSVIYSE
jgi:uridylate kinase